MSTQHTPEKVTDREAARELFSAGYLQALEDVAKTLAVPASAGFLEKLRRKAASVSARAAISQAISTTAGKTSRPAKR